MRPRDVEPGKGRGAVYELGGENKNVLGPLWIIESVDRSVFRHHSTATPYSTI